MSGRGGRGGRVGLRLRLVFTFALVAALVSGALAVTSYLLVRRAVLDRASRQALREARAAVTDAVATLPPSPSSADVRVLLDRLHARGEFDVVAVGPGGGFQSTSISLSGASVPAALRAPVAAGRLAAVRTGGGQRSATVVGGRLPSGPDLYFFFSLADVVADLELLRNVLIGVGAGLVVASSVVGVVAGRGLLRPIRRARTAVHRIEVGLLDTRLPEQGRDEFADLAHSFNRMAGALEQTVAELRSLEESHRRFVSDVSHELRTPLTALTTAADVLEANSGGLNDTGQRAARILVLESRRLTSLVEDLMEISRLDAGGAAMAWQPVDLTRLVTRALETRGWHERVQVDVQPGAPAGAGTAAAGTGSAGIATFGDPRRLDAIVGNLVGNALEHGAPPVKVCVWRRGDELGVDVGDSGAGVRPEHLPHVFERFYKADPSRPRSLGSGLGLAIARENARLHGGDVTVVSPAGGGATFSCTLPRRTAPPVAQPLPDRDDAVTARLDHPVP